MKRCTKCGSITCCDTECRICGETLTYAELSMDDRESVVPCGYAVRYYVKKFALPVISVLFAVGTAVLSGSDGNLRAGFIVLVALSLAVAAAQTLIEMFYPNVIGALTRRYTREYAETMLKLDITIVSMLIIAASVIAFIILRR